MEILAASWIARRVPGRWLIQGQPSSGMVCCNWLGERSLLTLDNYRSRSWEAQRSTHLRDDWVYVTAPQCLPHVAFCWSPWWSCKVECNLMTLLGRRC